LKFDRCKRKKKIDSISKKQQQKMAATSSSPASSSSIKDHYECVRKSARFVRDTLGVAEIALVLGSGLKDFEKFLSNKKSLSFAQVPGMPTPSVKGHPGRLIYGFINKTPIYCLAGRSHMYEGVPIPVVTFASRMLAFCGVKLFMATNAAGGGRGLPSDVYLRLLDSDSDRKNGASDNVPLVVRHADDAQIMMPGNLMILADHVNMAVRSPIDELSESVLSGQRHVAAAAVHSVRVARIANEVAQRMAEANAAGDESTPPVRLFAGCYACTTGPSYETRVEVEALSKLGVSAFGMSTVPGVVSAHAMGVETFALSLITNQAAGFSSQSLSHEEVTECGLAAASMFEQFMSRFIDALTVDATVRPPSLDDDDKDSEFAAAQPAVRPQPRSASSAHVAEARAALVEALGAGVEHGRALLVVGRARRAGVDALAATSAPPLLLRSLPHYPIVSRASESAGAIALRHGGVAIVCDALEGFSCEEGVFVGELLASLGVRRLGAVLSAGAIDGALPLGSVAVLADVFDVAGAHPLPAELAAGKQWALIGTRVLGDDIDAQLALAPDGAAVAGAAMLYRGPSFPSELEVCFARRAGCALESIASGAPLFAARALGIQCSALASVDYVSPKRAHGEPKSSVDSNALVAAALAIASRASTDAPAPSLPSLDGNARQLAYVIAEPISQGDVAAIRAEVARVAEQLDLASLASPPTAVLLDAASIGMLGGVDAAAKSVEVRSGDVVVALRLASVGESTQPLLVVEQRHAAALSGQPLNDLAIAVRVLGELKVPRIVAVASLLVADDDEAGRLVPIADHVNLTGRNPLYGANRNEFGDRFFDVQNAYDKSMTAQLGALLGGNVPSVRYLAFLGPLYRSDVPLRLAASLDCQAASSSSLAFDALVAAHHRVPFCAVGVTRSSVAASPSSALNDDLQSLINRFVAGSQ
jgi:purine-nucleoside phosphorylase